MQGVLIRKGTVIIVPANSTNTSIEFWGDDAKEFNPDRWLSNGKADKTGGAVNNYGFMTFIHGPRSCIGKDFARSELMCLLAAWYGMLEFEPESLEMVRDIEKNIYGWVTLRPKHGMPMRIREVMN